MGEERENFTVLFVCTGNTCRSPMAAGLMNRLLSEANFNGVAVRSAGTGALNGWPAAPYALEVTKNWGIDISAHRSRALDRGVVEKADLVLCMAPEHHRTVKRLSSRAGKRSYLLASYPQIPEETPLARIEDPMGGDLEIYEKTFMKIDEHLRRIFSDILRKAKRSGHGKR